MNEKTKIRVTINRKQFSFPVWWGEIVGRESIYACGKSLAEMLGNLCAVWKHETGEKVKI